MYAWETIQTVVDYIEEHLAEPQSPEKLAEIAALSPFYFQRLFSRLVKRPVNEYIKLRRLAKACGKLEDTTQRILDIALASGFNSHEHFTKTFKHAFGITPEEYRKHPVRLNQFMKPDLAIGYTQIDEHVPLITDSIILEISRRTLNTSERYIGLSGKVAATQQIPLGETTGIDTAGQLWDSFHRKKSKLKGLIDNEIEFAASTMTAGEGEAFDYFVGALTQSKTVAYDEFVLWELPAAEYIVCSFEAESFKELTTSALGKSINYLFNIWLPKHQLTTQAFLAEKYLSASEGWYQMELWVIPIELIEESR